MSEEKEIIEVPEKFKKLVEEIEKMSVLDLSELVKVLEDRFGVSATPQMVAGVAPVASCDTIPAKEEKSSFYINTPSSPIADTDYFKKILVYDKYLKESRYKNLDDELKNWKRLEITVNIKFKFKDFLLDDYIADMQNIATKYFNTLLFSYEYLELQNKLLTDRRTHKGVKSL